jgi:hypothetical protein
MDPATQSPTRQVSPLQGLSTASSVAVWVATVGSILMAASTSTFGWSMETAQSRIGMSLLGGGLLLNVLGQAVAGILVIAWLTRARANADALHPAPHRLAAGWAIGGWFVPIGNMLLPVVVVTDVIKASNPMRRSIPQVRLWWAGWIGGSLATPIGITALVTSDPLSRRGPAALALFLILAAVLYAMAAFTFRTIAKKVADWQDESIAQTR